jgi:hypothetical protein
MQLLINEKICYTCHVEKPLTDFHRDKRKKDGYHGCCKGCRSNKLSQGWEWVKCACDKCDEYVKSIDSNGRSRKFIRGHFTKTKKKKTIKLIPCKCSCGTLILERDKCGRKRS